MGRPTTWLCCARTTSSSRGGARATGVHFEIDCYGRLVVMLIGTFVVMLVGMLVVMLVRILIEWLIRGGMSRWVMSRWVMSRWVMSRRTMRVWITSRHTRQPAVLRVRITFEGTLNSIEIARAFEDTATESQPLVLEIPELRPKIYSHKIKGGVSEARIKVSARGYHEGVIHQYIGLSYVLAGYGIFLISSSMSNTLKD